MASLWPEWLIEMWTVQDCGKFVASGCAGPNADVVIWNLETLSILFRCDACAQNTATDKFPSIAVFYHANGSTISAHFLTGVCRAPTHVKSGASSAAHCAVPIASID